ncbi:MAG: amphi-Trp domain-containing protein [Pseudomonadota bacterium]
MRQDKKMFTHVSLQNPKSIEPILTAISKGLAKGELKFSDEDDEIILNPEGLIRFKVSASKSENIHKINLKISWHVTEAELDNKKILAISS